MSGRGAARADRLRAIPLERVAEALGYRRDRRGGARWSRPGSAVSISGARFYDHIGCRGGGGAIDLAMHAAGCPFREALDLLERIAPDCAGPPPHQTGEFRFGGDRWRQVRRYLTGQRGLDPDLVDRCRKDGLIGADRRANAVFTARGAGGAVTGAELRGTWPGRPFKGMAPGSRKALGGFWFARRADRPALLTESAVDALSALSLPELGHVGTVISTAGLTTRLPPWVAELGAGALICGYDADEAGDAAARLLIGNHPGIRRLRPEAAKDWNERLLTAGDRRRD